MNSNKRGVRDILKKIAYSCVAFIAIVIALAIALAISKIIFYIVLFAVYVIGAFVITILWVKMLSKILQYIDQRKKNK